MSKQEARRSIMGHRAMGLENLLVLPIVILNGHKLSSNQAHRSKCLQEDVRGISVTKAMLYTCWILVFADLMQLVSN